MAEIKIEKKRPIWPLLLGLAVIALLLYFLFFNNKKEVARDATPVADSVRTNGPVAAFVSFVNADTAQMRLDHAYTHGALVRLTDAIRAVAANAGYDVQADLDQANAYADKIIQDPYETTHADNIRKAADLLSSAIQNMQQAKFPALANEAAALKNAAAAIDPAVLTLDQKEAVKAFFKQAADVLQKMNS